MELPNLLAEFGYYVSVFLSTLKSIFLLIPMSETGHAHHDPIKKDLEKLSALAKMVYHHDVVICLLNLGV